MIHHTVRLQSQDPLSGRVPLTATGHLLRLLDESVRDSIAMTFEGRSRLKGRRPAWLKDAADVRLVDVDGTEATTLHFEAPSFGEVASELYTQSQLQGFETRPPENYTGFDLFAQILIDVQNENADSSLFDRRFLIDVKKYSRVFNGAFQGFVLGGLNTSLKSTAGVNQQIVEVAARLSDETPRPRQVRVVGQLDMIRHSTKSFELHLDDGTNVRGVLDNGEIESLTDLFTKRVIVTGRAEYRPSGKLLRVDAESVEDGTGAPSIWSVVPEPISKSSFVQSLRQPQTDKKGIKSFFGILPGDETDEEILEQFKKCCG